MREKSSRLENSKDVRRVLNRFGVDLTHCQYTVAGREVRLTGWLLKVDGSDFNANEVEYLIQELGSILRGFMVCGDMENWRFSSDSLQAVGENQNQEEAAADDCDAEVV